MSDGSSTPAVPAGTVIVVRDGHAGLEALLVRRTGTASFAADAWVFPGGQVDPGDLRPDDPDEIVPARRAAARELAEEAGVLAPAASLVPWARFTPPPTAPRRYATWFFVAPAPDGHGDVVVDGGEVDDHVWIRPSVAMAEREVGRLSLMPPTWVALWHLDQHPDTGSLLAHLRAREPELFEPRLLQGEGSTVVLYQGDAGYDDRDPLRPGRRHRLTMGPGPWQYLREL